MTTRELIEKLEDRDPSGNLQVNLDENGLAYPIVYVEVTGGGNHDRELVLYA